jgi:3-phosphoinositide dependent protein kinase-1
MAAAAAMQPQSAPPLQSQPSHTQTRRPQLHNVTELAPPSQLDIDWSPVLTRNNERILKLGNLIVTTAPASANSPTGKGGDSQTPSDNKPKFSRFFSSNTTKKRERLVLITTCARLVVAATGGNEKKAKLELNLAAGAGLAKSCVDGKGLTYWTFDTVCSLHSSTVPQRLTC